MPAYMIADVTVTNPEQMARYREWSTRAFAEFGVEVLVRGGEMDVLEGPWKPQRLVLLKFRDRVHAREFYNSATYTQARKVREGAGFINMVAVDGVA